MQGLIKSTKTEFISLISCTAQECGYNAHVLTCSLCVLVSLQFIPLLQLFMVSILSYNVFCHESIWWMSEGMDYKLCENKKDDKWNFN